MQGGTRMGVTLYACTATVQIRASGGIFCDLIPFEIKIAENSHLRAQGSVRRRAPGRGRCSTAAVRGHIGTPAEPRAALAAACSLSQFATYFDQLNRLHRAYPVSRLLIGRCGWIASNVTHCTPPRLIRQPRPLNFVRCPAGNHPCPVAKKSREDFKFTERSGKVKNNK